MLFKVLYSMNLKVVSHALVLLFVFCQVADSDLHRSSRDSFRTILSAASSAARVHDEPTFKVLVRHVAQDDLDVKLNSLCLINSLISAAPGRHERERLIFQLDRMRPRRNLGRKMHPHPFSSQESHACTCCLSRGEVPSLAGEWV